MVGPKSKLIFKKSSIEINLSNIQMKLREHGSISKRFDLIFYFYFMKRFFIFLFFYLKCLIKSSENILENKIYKILFGFNVKNDKKI